MLITGAGRGIGKRLALGFARLGARIGLIGRSRAEIDLAHIEIEQNGGNAIRLRADVTDPEQLNAAFERARIALNSSIDILIAAAATPGPLTDFVTASVAAWKEAIEINLLGVVNACRAAVPEMITRRQGKILVLTCDSDTPPKFGFSAYETSKTALVRFTESLAAELSDHNVQVNCFDPGPAYTSLTDEIIRAENRLEPAVIAAAKETRRTGGASPELQLEHATFLVSEHSNHISGKLIHITDDLRKLRNAALRPDSFTLRRVTK